MPSGPEGLETFWAQMSKHPACENHQLLLEPGYARKTIPVHIHGDCVPCTGIGKVWSKGLLALHWTSALSNGSSKTNCFSLFTVFEKLVAHGENGTVDRLFDLLSWSFNAMFHGVWPATDFQGKEYLPGSAAHKRAGPPLAGGSRCCVAGTLGDLEYTRVFLRLPRWSSAENCCSLCLASKRPHWRQDAAWTTTTWRPDTWRVWRNKSTSSIFKIIGVTACSIAADFMHSKYLGADQYIYIYASIMFIIIYILLPSTPEQNTLTMWEFIRAYYKPVQAFNDHSQSWACETERQGGRNQMLG
ncbi:Uncharacterized protein SCF082_LOCUS3127 [Durusdinium trenchii]|uniref:Uncharacterized protein n=1 Tax=Durusdinium trenchii TaxID=1381693 RepID=A0ABP0HS18_9DINO